MRPSSPERLLAPVILASGFLTLGVAACVEETPTTLDEGLLPTEPVTVEIELPWAEFASNLEVLGGYGSPQQIGAGIIANAFSGTLTAKTLVRFPRYPIEVVVTDTLGATQIEQDITFVGGRVNVRFDTLSSTNGRNPVTVSASSIQNAWDAATVDWVNGVDSVGDTQPWPQAGADPVRLVSTAEWDPAEGDTVQIALDSAAVADMTDENDPSRGVRIDLVTAGERVEIDNVQLWLEILPASNPDTIVVDTIPMLEMSFVYDPPTSAPVNELRIGGAPAWRTVLDVDLPVPLTGPPELCAVVSCPVQLEAGQVSYAALVLRSSQVDPPFAPTDSLSFDARPVLNRAALPKAPLGGSLVDIFDVLVAPDVFGPASTTAVEIPITPFVRDLLTEVEPGSFPPSNTLALLATLEPISFSYGSFFGPGLPEETVLRLILTIGPPVELP